MGNAVPYFFNVKPDFYSIPPSERPVFSSDDARFVPLSPERAAEIKREEAERKKRRADRQAERKRRAVERQKREEEIEREDRLRGEREGYTILHVRCKKCQRRMVVHKKPGEFQRVDPDTRLPIRDRWFPDNYGIRRGGFGNAYEWHHECFLEHVDETRRKGREAESARLLQIRMQRRALEKRKKEARLAREHERDMAEWRLNAAEKCERCGALATQKITAMRPGYSGEIRRENFSCDHCVEWVRGMTFA